MVGLNTNNPTRDQVLRFMDEKERIEREMQELHMVLESNNVGMTDPLVDAEGFPRNDIDVYRVRHARHQIICLQNDHKELLKQIERGLHNLHAEYRGAPGDAPSSSAPRSHDEAMDVSSSSSAVSINGEQQTGYFVNDRSERIGNGYHSTGIQSMLQATNSMRVDETPFVRVNFVSSGSPAETAGIREHDEILRFGSLTSRNFTNLSQIADIVQHSVGGSVEVRVRRGDELLNFSLVPGPWSGRGLLGCNVVPV